MIINRIIAVEGLDRVGKSTFIKDFIEFYNKSAITENLKSYKFPNEENPIGFEIRSELENGNKTIISDSPVYFLTEMSLYWNKELYENYENKIKNENSSNIINEDKPNYVNYIFDRYVLSTLAYQAYTKNNKINLEYIKYFLNNNQMIKLPTHLIFLDAPNNVIIERTKNDTQDSNDTIDEELINKRRNAYKKSIELLKRYIRKIIYIDDVTKYSNEELVSYIFGKIF